MIEFTRLFILSALFLSLSGCGFLLETSEKAASKIGEGVQYYCENTAVEIREQFRIEVNRHASPHAIQVQCAGGPTLQSQ